MASRAIRCGLLDKGNRRRAPQSPINAKQLDPYLNYPKLLATQLYYNKDEGVLLD